MNGSGGVGRPILASPTVSPVTLASELSVTAVTDAVAFAPIYEEHFSFVWRCLRGLGVAPLSLEDAAQDVFVVVHRRLASFQHESSLRTWVFGIVRRIAYRYRRSVKRKGPVAELEQEPPTSDPGPLERAQDVEAAAFVDRFASQLDDRKREVFVLGVLEGLTVPEIAEALGVPLNTAYTRLRRARAEFRHGLTQRLVKP
jgi:RNA polymerase sigma-70 factor (ECF subfamily)